MGVVGGLELAPPPPPPHLPPTFQSSLHLSVGQAQGLTSDKQSTAEVTSEIMSQKD